MPFAARQGDFTAHAGLISSGARSVLIEGKPAARVGDGHLCPMLNPGPIPHVGGAVLDGEQSVLIESQPAATQGSSCQCVAAIDTISVGSNSVLIGSASCLSRAGQLCVSDLQHAWQQQAPGKVALYSAHFLQVHFFDDSGNPLFPLPYRLTIAGQSETGMLDKQGSIRRYYLAQAGRCSIHLVALQALAWSQPSCAPGERIQLKVEFCDATQSGDFLIDIYGLLQNGQPRFIQQLSALCRSGLIEQDWQVPYSREYAAATDDAPASLQGFFFSVTLAGQVFRSDRVNLKHHVEIELQHLPLLKFKPITLYFTDGSVEQAAFDSRGHYFTASLCAGVYRFEYHSHQVMYPE